MITTPTACIQAEKENVAKVVLMPGDPLRAKYIAETYLENPVLFNSVRNMFGYTGTYKGKRFLLWKWNGYPSISLYAMDLYSYFDVEAIIRIGSAGAIADGVKLRDVVIAMSASTNSNYDSQYGFIGTLAPTANYEMLSYAADSAKEKGASVKIGSIFTTDTFYNANEKMNQKAKDLNLLCVEMETAGLYWTAAYLHKKALSMLTISDNVFTGEELSVMERQESFNEMMEIALETAWKTID
ncbi:MAG: purine-nucleoside phosphorylase [Frisingicoccus sp.]